jgi:hypothetical protein
MRNLVQLAVVVITLLTLMLVSAVGVSASSGKLGAAPATTASILTGHSDFGFLKDAGNFLKGELDKIEGRGNEGRECKPPKKDHEDGTPGHENHPCGDKGRRGH